MKKFKRVLSLLLVFCMMFSMPFTAFADEVAEKETYAGDVNDDALLDSASLETNESENESESEETVIESEVPLENMPDLLSDDVAVTSVNTGTKPVNGTTTENPFVKGTAGSNSFRIPAMVTLSDGRIVAAADARWNTTYDGGGLDTIVSYSDDNGANWNYTFANYLGDNGNTYNGSASTAFIDPALATNGSTVYMLCDLYPYGVALNGSKDTAPTTAVGFNDDGNLLLAPKGTTSYDYYLDLDKYQIKSSDGTVISDYTVDKYFNITNEDGTVDSNLFFSDSPYQVVRTGYLYLTKSTDGGATWSEPTLIPNVKTSSEQVCLVGPGRGLVTSGGMIIFPCYSYNGSSESQRMSFIYSTDAGTTWSRSSGATSSMWSSEAAVVELTDGTLRFFFRNGQSSLYYVDYSNNSWGDPVNTGIATNSNTQISAIKYSKTVDGKEVILVSCPTGSNGNGSADSNASARLNGKIFVGYVESDGTMTWDSNKAVEVTSNNKQFMYSCLTELNDGKVAILYEDQESNWGTGDDCYYTMSFATYDLALASDTTTDSDDSSDSSTDTTLPEYSGEPVEINLTVGEQKTVEDTTGDYESSYDNSGLDESVATVVVDGTTVEGTVTLTDVSSITSGNSYCIKSTDGTKYLNSNGGWTTKASEAAEWIVIRSSGMYNLKNGDNNLYYNDGWTVSTSSSTKLYYNNGTFYRTREWSWSGYSYSNPLGTAATKSSTEAINSTKITFTGVSVGTTSTVVGSTLYSITVTKGTKDVTLNVGNTSTFTDGTASKGFKNTNSDIVSVSTSDTGISFTGIAEGTATVETAGVTYNIKVINGTDLSIKENETTTISVDLNEGDTVEWSSSDSSYVGVAGKYDTASGAYNDSAIIAGQNVTTNPVTVTGKVTRADGSVETYKWFVTVTEGDADTNTNERDIYISIDEIQNCTVYYSVNGGELVKVNGTGAWVENGHKEGHFNVMFFAAPYEGYALTYMYVEKSGNQYYPLSNGNPDGTGSSAWPFDSSTQTTIPTSSDDSAWVSGHGFRWALLEGNMTIDQMKVLFTNAINLGCDGATNFTKNANDSFGSENDPNSLQFVAQKLPTVEKTIKSITHDGKTTEYTEGMKVELGDTITYDVVVTRYATNASYGTITYSNESLNDALTKNDGITNPDMGESTTSDATYQYQTSVTLTMANFSDLVKEGVITNTAEFSYDYQSEYSTGSLSANASAAAEITVTMPEYVIDFGLPIQIDLSSVLGNTQISSGSATYGNVSANGTSFTYTPSKILKNVDYVTFSLNNGGSYAVTIYPATTVYYEEDFAAYSGFTTDGTDKNSSQQAAVPGQEGAYNYGYDAVYVDDNFGVSNGTEVVSKTVGSTGELEFTGTGIDVYTNTSEKTGTVMIKLYQNGALKKLISIDTAMKNGDTDATTGQAVTAYNVPIVSITGLEHGTYTLKLSHVKAGSDQANRTDGVKIDGYRVHGTMGTSADSIYAKDSEYNPVFVELRDSVLQVGLNANASTSKEYAEQIASNVMSQVYALNANGVNALVLSPSLTDATDATVTDFLDNGPKNEIYLQNGETLVFSTNAEAVQIGLKALNNNTSYSINNGEVTNLNTSTDMFYEIASGTTTITNEGDGILSVTELKLFNPSTEYGIATVSEEVVTYGLLRMGYASSEPEVTYADASLTVAVIDEANAVIASTELTANGVTGEIHTFTAAEIEAAVAGLTLPENYVLNNATYADVTIVYGESDTVTFASSEKVVETETETESETKPEEKPDTNETVTQIVNIVNKIFSSFRNFLNSIFGR